MLYILAIGKIGRNGAAELCAEYEKRIAKISIREFDLKERDPKILQARESQALLNAIPEDCFTVALDKI